MGSGGSSHRRGVKVTTYKVAPASKSAPNLLSSLRSDCVISKPSCNRKEFVEFLKYIDSTESKFEKLLPPLGYMVNQRDIGALGEFRTILTRHFCTNNIGDPFQEDLDSHPISFNMLKVERDVLLQLMEPWGGTAANCWGYVTTGSTEAVTKGLSTGTHRLHMNGHKRVMAIWSEQAHYCVPKAMHMLLGEANEHKSFHAIIPPNCNGEMSLDKLRDVVGSSRMLQVDAFLVCTTLGTTFQGANDDVRGVLKTFADAGYPRGSVYLHVDAAFHGGWWHDCMGMPSYQIGSDFDSLSISSHKWHGGVVGGMIMIFQGLGLAEGTNKIDYVKMIDKAISGSRNGHAGVLWQARLCQFDWKSEFVRCQANAIYLVRQFEALGVRCHRQNLTVIFPKPSQALSLRHTLLTVGDQAQIVLMPHVERADLDAFLEEYSAEPENSKSTRLLEELACA